MCTGSDPSGAGLGTLEVGFGGVGSGFGGVESGLGRLRSWVGNPRVLGSEPTRAGAEGGFVAVGPRLSIDDGSGEAAGPVGWVVWLQSWPCGDRRCLH